MALLYLNLVAILNSLILQHRNGIPKMLV